MLALALPIIIHYRGNYNFREGVKICVEIFIAYECVYMHTMLMCIARRWLAGRQERCRRRRPKRCRISQESAFIFVYSTISAEGRTRASHTCEHNLL